MGLFQQSVYGLILTGIFVGILGCGPITPLTTEMEGLHKRGPDPVELVERLAQRGQQLRSLRSLATVSYWGADGRGGFQEAILVQRPDRLRLETLSPLGATLIVTVDGNEVVGFHPREGLFYRGRSSKENLFHYIQVPLELGEVTSLLMGIPPVPMEDRWEAEGGAIYRETGEGGRDKVFFHGAFGVPVRWERFNSGGEMELSALFSDFSPTPAGLFPMRISLEAALQQKRLEIRYQDPELNVALPLAIFVQEKPTNVKEIPLESLGG